MKVIKHFFIGVLLSMLITLMWIATILGFINTADYIGYRSVGEFFLTVLALAFTSFLSWVIGYAVDTMKSINEKNENDDFCSYGKRRDT